MSLDQLVQVLHFQFVMPRGEVERRTMWISVWHSDMFGRNDFLGEVMMPMAGQVFDDPAARWCSLQDRVGHSPRQHMSLKLIFTGIK